MKIIQMFICGVIMSFAMYYVSCKIYEKEFNLKSIRVNLILIIQSIMLLFFYLYAPANILRVCLNVLIISVVNYYGLQSKGIKNIIGSFMVFSIIAISEILWTFLFITVTQADIQVIQESYFVRIQSNLMIAVFMIILINIKPFLQFFQKLLRDIYIKRNFKIVLWIISSIFCLSILFYYIYFNVSPAIGLLITVILIVCYTSLPLILIKEKSRNFQLQSEYAAMIKNLDDYEKMLDIQRIRNHENNNVLLSIKGMVGNKNKEAIEFINGIIKDKNEDDQYLIMKTKNIPTGGLQGLIYQKILLMKKLNINYSVEISKEVKRVNFNGKKADMIKDVCTVVGVFLDNAIQEVQNHPKKLMGVYLYVHKNSLVISVSNNFIGRLDVEKFDENRYTTKGSGHGYGLSLVKSIVEKNRYLENKRIINGNIFSQNLEINIKNLEN